MKDKDKKPEKVNFVKRILGRKKLLALIIIISVLGFVGFRKFVANKSSGESTPVEVKRGTVYEELILSGEIKADEYIALSYPVSGKVAWVGVKEGDKVKKGQSLGKLDTLALNAAYQQALSNLRAAEATVAYVHDQVKDNDADESFSQKDTRTTAEVAKDKAYEAVKIAQDNLRNATLYSPFEGVVTNVVAPFPGINVVYTQTQFEVINPKTIYFEVGADQTEVVNIRLDQKVKIVLDSYPDEDFEGLVSFVSYTPRAGDVGTTYEVKIKFEDKITEDIQKFRIGLGGDAKFIMKQADNVLYLPPNYVKTDSKGSYVNLGKKNNKIYIETGLESEDAIEVKSDKLNEGVSVYD